MYVYAFFFNMKKDEESHVKSLFYYGQHRKWWNKTNNSNTFFGVDITVLYSIASSNCLQKKKYRRRNEKRTESSKCFQTNKMRQVKMVAASN